MARSRPAGQCCRCWCHPDDGEAEDRVQHDLPVQGLHRGCDCDGAECQPDQQGHQGAGFLDEGNQGFAALAAGGTVLKTSLSKEDEKELQEALYGGQAPTQ